MIVLGIFNTTDVLQTYMLALCIWREARGECREAKIGVGYTVVNRLGKHSSSYGTTLVGVITHKWQFSSFNQNDANATKWPEINDAAWDESCVIAYGILADVIADTTGGAVLYYDKSLDASPPFWAAKATHLCDIGAFHFFR